MSNKINNTIKSVAYSLGLDEQWLYENLDNLRAMSTAYVVQKKMTGEYESDCDCKCSKESCL